LEIFRGVVASDHATRKTADSRSEKRGFLRTSGGRAAVWRHSGGNPYTARRPGPQEPARGSVVTRPFRGKRSCAAQRRVPLLVDALGRGRAPRLYLGLGRHDVETPFVDTLDDLLGHLRGRIAAGEPLA